MKINVHTHYQPESVLEIVKPYGITMEQRPEGWFFRSGSVEYSIPGTAATFWGSGLGGQIADMDAAGIDVNVLQPSPMVFGYHLPAEVNETFSRAFNDATAAHMAEFPGRFWGSAQLPMQDLDRAAAELTRAVEELGLVSCSINYMVGDGVTLAHPRCDGFLSVVEALDVPILLHPVALGQDLDLERANGGWLLDYQVDWAWGYLFVETVAIIGMIFGGAFDRHPKLRLMIPHGGGMVPYQIGRLEHHARMYGKTGMRLERPLLDYLDNLYFDTVLHDPRSLKLLIDVVGVDRVVMGSNYPGWDNAPIWETIARLDGVDAEAKRKIMGLNAAERLFRRPLAPAAAPPPAA
jgi:aminocarboxymuconate-semialdehyde decarboxylase